jgi:hypothetical protein
MYKHASCFTIEEHRWGSSHRCRLLHYLKPVQCILDSMLQHPVLGTCFNAGGSGDVCGTGAPSHAIPLLGIRSTAYKELS